MKSRLYVRLILSLGIAALFVLVFRRGGLPLLPSRHGFAQVNVLGVLLHILLSAGGVYFRSSRWVYLLRPIDPVAPRRAFGVSLIGFGAVFLAPLRTGEIVRPWLITRYSKVSILQATGTVAAERVIDGLLLSTILSCGLLFSTRLSPLPDHVGGLWIPVSTIPSASYAALSLFACAFITIFTFHFQRKLVVRIVRFLFEGSAPRFAGFLTVTLVRIAEGLQFLPSPRHLLPFLRDTLAYWICGVLSLLALMRGCGMQGSIAQACVTLGVLGLGILLPAGPGFFGAFQISIYGALAMFFPETTVIGPGATFLFLLYVIQFTITTCGTLIGWRMLKSRIPFKKLPLPPQVVQRNLP